MGGRIVKLRLFAFLILAYAFTIAPNKLMAINSEISSWVQFIADGTNEEIIGTISRQRDINKNINKLGWTFLHAAVKFRRVEVVEKLIELNANQDIQDYSGQTPLLIAVESGQIDIVELLLKNGANVNIANNNGENPLSLAKKIELNKISEVLLKNGAKMSIPGEEFQGHNKNLRKPDNEEISTRERDSILGKEIELDPNEIQARVEKYPGLKEAIMEIAGESRSSLANWRKVDRDNKRSLISAIRKQYDREVEFIQKIAVEEKAQKTIEQADNLRLARKKTFIIINKEVMDSGNQNRLNARTTGTRRTGRAANRNYMRGGRRGMITQQNTGAQEQEEQYSNEIKDEINDWLRSDIMNINSRMTLLDSVNNTIVAEINSIKQTAAIEEAEKTIAAIDGILLARQMRFDLLYNEFLENQKKQRENQYNSENNIIE
jgi:hypothetical protein